MAFHRFSQGCWNMLKGNGSKKIYEIYFKKM